MNTSRNRNIIDRNIISSIGLRKAIIEEEAIFIGRENVWLLGEEIKAFLENIISLVSFRKAMKKNEFMKKEIASSDDAFSMTTSQMQIF